MIFRRSFAPAGRFARRCDDLLKTCKNHVFLQVFSMFALARTLRKSIQNPSERASRASRATDRFRNALFSSLRASKWSPIAPRSASRGLLGPSWTLLGRPWDALGRLLGALGCPRAAPGLHICQDFFFKIYQKNTKIDIFKALGLLLGGPQTIRHRFLTLRGSILTLRGMISRPSHRQTPSPNSSKVLAKSWRSPCENHNQHSVQPKRMNSKRWCGGLASAFSIRRTLRLPQGAKRFR